MGYANGMAIPSSSRLTEPLIRENGGHRSASWDEALETIAARLREVIRMVGPLPPWLASVLGVAGLLLVLAAAFALVRFIDAAWAGRVTRPAPTPR